MFGEFEDACLCFYPATACNATHGIAKAFLPVCLSVKRVNCDKTKGTYAHIHESRIRILRIFLFLKFNEFYEFYEFFLKSCFFLHMLESKRRTLVSSQSLLGIN